VRIEDFDYPLPRSAIAQEPLAERDASRLLVLDRRTRERRHHAFRDLPDLLAPGDLVVVNRSRVFPARLLGQRPGGEPAEILLVRSLTGDDWEALLRPGKRLRPGTVVAIGPDLEVEILDAPAFEDGRRLVRLRPLRGTVDEALERAGHVPLPPYIRRPDREDDRHRYQTVFARERGSVAAPTAGLHFTPGLLARLQARGIERAEVVLHVGLGTFRPVQVEDVRDHRVPAEPFVLPEETAAAIARARQRGGRIVAVGTTTTRVLESRAEDIGGPAEVEAVPGPAAGVAAGAGETDLVIAPPFSFRVTDALLTNFHLPRSSLLLLVAAFAGRETVLDTYAEAVREGYRFYSYGDAMLVL
jgi:S-adenosylmethionine:tRNA ribosyltransferase-isomerase